MDFSKQIQKAEEAAKRRNYDFAIQLYRQILEIDADQGEARAGLRQALKKRHDPKKGRLFRSIAGAPQLAAGKALHKAGKHLAAAKSLEAYLDGNPYDEAANLLLGQVLEEARCFRSALAVYEFVAEIAPKSPAGLKRAGAMAARQGEHERALEYYEAALAADPRDQEAIKARKDLAAERALKRQDAGGVQHSRELIRDQDTARELERSQRIHRSEDELREELGRLEARYAEESTPELMLRLADVHEKLGDAEAALDWVERARSYRKDSFELLCRAGDLRSKVLRKGVARAGKDGDEAGADRLERELLRAEVEDYRARAALRPQDALLRLELGRRLVRVEDWDGAIAELQKAGGDPRTRIEAQASLARCFQAKGYTDLARKEYEQALAGTSAREERGKEILYNLGQIAESAGELAEARALYAQVFEVDIGYRDVARKMESLK